MDFTKQLTTPEGEPWEHNENFTDEKGIIQSRLAEFTYFKVARECLLGKVGGRILNSIFCTKWRWAVYRKIAQNELALELNFFDKYLLKRLAVLRFDVSVAAQLINKLDTK